MKRVITYGTFDLLHYGHINLLRRARALGDYLIVALSTDQFNHDSKNKVCYFTYEERKQLLESIRYVDLVIPEENWEQKVRDVREYHVDTFVMGDDWAGKFDFLKEYCEVVYLPRTPEISTTKMKQDMQELRKSGVPETVEKAGVIRIFRAGTAGESLRMKKVLEYRIGRSGDGVTRYILGNYARVDKEKIHMDFVTGERDLSFCRDLIEEGCAVYSLPASPFKNPFRFRREMKKLWEGGYDIIHCHMSYFLNTILFRQAKKHGVKIILHSHSTQPDIADRRKRPVFYPAS